MFQENFQLFGTKTCFFSSNCTAVKKDFSPFYLFLSAEFDEMQKEAIKTLVKKKNHHLISSEILKALENKSKEDIIQNNLNKSFVQSSMMTEEPSNKIPKSGGGMNLE